jgi:hypothetical protein
LRENKGFMVFPSSIFHGPPFVDWPASQIGC